MAILKAIFRDRFKVSEQRLEHCRQCEFLEERTMRCKKCGCFLEAKTLLPWTECPIGKWGQHHEKKE